MAAILGALIAELRATPIVTFGHISLLRRYIEAKYPDLPLPQSTVILADAVNKIVEKKIGAISETYRPLIKKNLFRNIANRRFFQINAGDILEASLPLEWSEDHFQTELCHWVNQTLRKAVALDKLTGLLTKLANIYQQKGGRDLEALAGEIDRDGMPARLKTDRSFAARQASAKTAAVKRAGTKTAAAAPEKPLPKEKAMALAVWESTVFDASQLPEFSEPANPRPGEASRQAVATFLSGAEASPGEDKKSAARQVPFKPGRVLLVGVAAAIAFVIIIFGLLCAILSNKAVLASDATVGLRTGRHVNLVRLSREISVLEERFAEYQATAGRDTVLTEPSMEDADHPPISALSVPSTGAAADRPLAAIIADDKVNDNTGGGTSGLKLNEPVDGDAFLMRATAYDLSVESCGKEPDHPLYGITRSGIRAQFGRTIAVDPRVIPLGSKVKLTFPDHFSYLDGIYVAEDTGSAIKGNRIDLFMGEDQPGEKFVYDNAMKFGIQQVKLQVLQ